MSNTPKRMSERSWWGDSRLGNLLKAAICATLLWFTQITGAWQYADSDLNPHRASMWDAKNSGSSAYPQDLPNSDGNNYQYEDHEEAIDAN